MRQNITEGLLLLAGILGMSLAATGIQHQDHAMTAAGSLLLAGWAAVVGPGICQAIAGQFRSRRRSGRRSGAGSTPQEEDGRAPAVGGRRARLKKPQGDEEMASITIHTDGSCLGNPGPGGYAAIIEIPRHDPIVVTGSELDTTNNRMEIRAVIEGLRELTELANVQGTSVEVRSDSKYVCDAFNQHWMENWQRNGWRTANRQPVKNQDLWEELRDLSARADTGFTHVRGHSGDPRNEECDRLANVEANQAARTGTATGPHSQGTLHPGRELEQDQTQGGHTAHTEDHGNAPQDTFARKTPVGNEQFEVGFHAGYAEGYTASQAETGRPDGFPQFQPVRSNEEENPSDYQRGYADGQTNGYHQALENLREVINRLDDNCHKETPTTWKTTEGRILPP